MLMNNSSPSINNQTHSSLVDFDQPLVNETAHFGVNETE